ncbi:protein drumstick isoform X1 [Hylaeus anthracinus]|uniref:protein drumstick isoform X1 n=1 Tax=Hylaeus anthracinus TaxID=313031 RepID=UPI0023B9B753|nr:protein drumstick isoform X1 [Hylaeus anthracinus]
MFAIMPMETEGHGREFGRRQKMRAKCTVEFVCKYCQRRFTKPYNLMIHERSHKDDVTFTCEVCGKSFKRQDNLKQHRYHFSLFLFFLPLVFFFLFIIFLLSHRVISPRTREIFFCRLFRFPGPRIRRRSAPWTDIDRGDPLHFLAV